MDEQISGFIDFFKEVPEILLFAFCEVIAGCDSWDDLELFRKTKLDYLRKYLTFKEETPSDNTLRRFFSRTK